MTAGTALALQRVDALLDAAIRDGNLRAATFLLRLTRHLRTQARRRGANSGQGAWLGTRGRAPKDRPWGSVPSKRSEDHALR